MLTMRSNSWLQQKKDNAAEAVPARTTRGRSRSQRTVVLAVEDEAPKARRTSRRAAARKTEQDQEEEGEATQGKYSFASDQLEFSV